MGEKPILMSTENVKAILQGRKNDKKVYTNHGNENDLRHILKRIIYSVTISDFEKCWEWKRFINKDGYGTFTLNKKSRLVHRVMYFLFHGEFDNNLSVCHKWDNPKCVNPNHLFLGTRSDNMKDCFNKGRSNIKVVSFKGETNPMSKITRFQAMKIRKMAQSGEVTQRTIADYFGISQAHVSLIKLGKLWK